ncbi:hypothetical protein AB9P05_16955 [Roseivirga sp. BDSF3-8]|uniref:hypothetical protein n=1 Tax=Roseivirga sp. BDSF3-8 TaxID=3241598 RepID=UPI003531BEE1
MKKKLSLEDLKVKSFRTESVHIKAGMYKEVGDGPKTLGEETCVLCGRSWNCA